MSEQLTHSAKGVLLSVGFTLDRLILETEWKYLPTSLAEELKMLIGQAAKLTLERWPEGVE